MLIRWYGEKIKMSEPVISAVIPVYNGEKYIMKIYNCLLNQTFEDFEVIFINDGSKDGTEKLLKKICDNKKYRYVSQENKGVSAARNLGLKNSEGKYICFIDVDDLVSERYFEVLYKNISNREDCVAFCKTGYNNDKKNISDINAINIVCYSQNEALEKFLYRQICPGIWGMIIPRKIIKENNIFFKEGFKYSEDVHMVWRVFANVSEVVYIDEALYIYQENQESAMTKIDDNRFDSMKLTEDLLPFFERNNKPFYKIYSKYAVGRMAWSLLWQSAHYLDKTTFKEYCCKYDFKTDLKKLIDFPDFKVKVLSKIYLKSSTLYYYIIKLITICYRR